MSYTDEILQFNRQFVAEQKYEPYLTTKYPNKHIAVLSCMDTRLTELLPAALNCKNGDIKIIKNAGGVISHPFGSVVRSLLVAIYELDVHEILVIGHYDCGMQNTGPTEMIEKMKQRGIQQQEIDFIRYCGIDLDRWLQGFADPRESVQASVDILRMHPLIPKDVLITGFVMDPATGRLDPLD